MKFTKVIRSDKNQYRKLGDLQSSATKGQVSLKGWTPDPARY